MKNSIRLTLLLLFVFQKIFTQELQIDILSQTKSCSGTLVEFSYTYLPTENSVTEFNFDNGSLPAGWTSSPYDVGTPCSAPRGDSPTGTSYYWATTTQNGGIFDGTRFVQTAPVNVSNGGSIEGVIRYGADDPSPGCEDPDAANEEVYLMYSIDGGLNYYQIYGGWNTTSGYAFDWYDWDEFDISIPEAAQSSSTIFLFYQPTNSGDEWDNWGLDDIIVNAIPPDPSAYDFEYLGIEATSYTTSSTNISEFILIPPSYSQTSVTITVSVTLQDGSIFPYSQVVSIIASDDTPPNIDAPVDLNLDTDPGRCYAGSVILGNPITSDNCSIHSYSNNAPDRFLPGITEVTWTVSDSVGNISTDKQFITVSDNESPTINAPADINSSNCSVILGLPVTDDNCAIHSFSNDAPDEFPTGVTTVTWTVSDTSGNYATDIQLVTVNDDVEPSIIAPVDINIDTDPGRCYAGSVLLGVPVTSDNCSVHSYSNNAPDRFLTGVTTVTWTVSDTSGNVSTAFQLVTVTDNELPSANISNTLSSECVVVVPAAYNDNCGIFKVTNDAPVEFPSGLTTITWEIEDTNNNTIFVESTVTVSDTTNPVIISPNDILITADPGSCFATGLFLLGNPITSDNCDVDQVTNNAPVNFPIGVTTITWTVSDTSGNLSTDTQVITVIDNENPLIDAPADQTVEADLGQCSKNGLALGIPVISDNCATSSFSNNAPAVFPIGVTTITWTVSDTSGNTFTDTQIITITDSQSPTIVAPIDINTNSDFGLCTASGVVLGVPITSDNCNIHSFSNDAPEVFPTGVTTITWIVSDTYGNINIDTQIVTISDNESPTITAPNDIISADCDVEIGIPVTSDNCAIHSFSNDAPAVFPTGVTTVTWTVSDTSGNINTDIQIITVLDDEAPTITSPANITVNADLGFCSASGVVLGIPVTTDNCATHSYSNDAPAIFPIGVTTITWVVSDTSGNVSTALQFITVNDNNSPIITAPADINTASCTFDIGLPIVSDDCSSVTYSNNAPIEFPSGITTITWTASDTSGNISTDIQIVNVNDNVPPVISDIINFVINNDPGLCTSSINIGEPTITDNCELFSISNDAPGIFPIGITVVTWSVTDTNGNFTSSVQTITVLDNENPSITAPGNVTVNTDPGLCSASGVVLGVPVTTDNCATHSFTNDAPGVFPTGVTTVTWTVSDTSGNVSSALQFVTVLDNENPSITAPGNVTVNTD
ncbi:MAG: hypothetical protein ACO2ZG_02945, partial [Flavobacteriaceae bacterium]